MAPASYPALVTSAVYQRLLRALLIRAFCQRCLCRCLLLDDPDSDFRLHIRVQADGHPVDAKGLDRLVEVDLTLLDVEALRLELLGDVRRRDGPEQVSFLAHLGREGDGAPLELLTDALGAPAAVVFRRRDAIDPLVDALQ